MKKYDKYQESGDPKLGIVPANWRITALKRVTEFKYGDALQGETRNDEGNVNVYGSNGIVGKHDHAITQAPCIIIGRKGSYGKVNYSEEPCFPIDTAYFIDETTTANELRFVYYLVQTCELDINSRDSAVPGLSREEAYNKTVALPPLPEQRAIAAYLDHKTAQLDTLLAQKETLLRLLHQKRQALINEAVTQGLDPAVPRKPSGVAWLGDVPAHWGVKALKYLLAAPMMYGANEAAELDDRTLPRYIRITDFGQNGQLRDETFKSLPHEVAKDYLLQNDDILFARSGATVGKTFFFTNYEGQACFAGYLIKATFDTKKVLPEFVYLYTKSGLYDNWKNSIFIQSTIQNISAEKYKALLLAVPPIAEQKEIIVWLEQRNRKLDAAANAIHTQIKTLKAYRQSLILEVVTGKVDVRTEAQALAGTAPTPSPTRQASQPAPARPAAVGQLNLF